MADSENRTAPTALNQNRTDDLILTMDVLCQLSYKGQKHPKKPAVFGDTSANLHSTQKNTKKSELGQ